MKYCCARWNVNEIFLQIPNEIFLTAPDEIFLLKYLWFLMKYCCARWKVCENRKLIFLPPDEILMKYFYSISRWNISTSSWWKNSTEIFMISDEILLLPMKYLWNISASVSMKYGILSPASRDQCSLSLVVQIPSQKLQKSSWDYKIFHFSFTFTFNCCGNPQLKASL